MEPVVVERQRRLGRRAVAGRVLAELGRRRIRGQRRDHRDAVAADTRAHARRLERRGRDRRLREDVDRAAAGEPHVPRLLVADPVANHAGVPRLPRSLDLLRGRALDAAAADRARDPAVGGREQDRALGSRRGAERPDHHGAAGGCSGIPPVIDRREQLLHRRLTFRAHVIRGGADGSTGWLGDERHRRRGVAGTRTGGPEVRRDVRGRLSPPIRIARADAGEDLAEPLQAGDAPGGQEVVDVRERGAHPRGERLVAGRPGQGIEPDEPVAAPPESRRFCFHERGVAAIPAVGHDDDDAAGAERPPRPAQVEVAERLPDPRPAGPVVDAVGHAREGAVAIPVAEQARDAREPRPEDERLGPNRRRRRERLDEPEQEPRMALHRARDVAQDDDRARPAALATPHPVQDLAARAGAAPEHHPRRDPPAVRMELVAARAPELEARLQQVDEALGVAQLGRRHPVEVAVPEDLGAAVGVRRNDDLVARVVAVIAVVVVGRQDRTEQVVGALGARLAALRPIGLELARLAALDLLHRALRPLRRHRKSGAPEPVEDRVVDRPVVAPADEHGGARGLDVAPVAEVDDVERAREIDLRAEVDLEPRLAQRPPECDRLLQQPASVDCRRGPEHRPVASSRRPPQSRPGTPGPWSRGRAGCPPRT